MMRSHLWIAVALVALSGGAALAQSPDSSLRPIARGGVSEPAAPAATEAAAETRRVPLLQRLRPNARPKRDLKTPETARRPEERPEKVVKRGLFKKRQLRKGSVCGDIAIQGDKVGSIAGTKSGCGVAEAVRVRSVAGVALSRPATMDCGTATALRQWVEKGLQPAFRKRSQVVELRVAAHYICRTRNNRPGAKISEHGKGRAIDLSAFTLKSGEVVTVLNGWHSKSWGRNLQKAYRAACGPFGTTLGPKADRYHQDHFHFDTARYRSGPYCK